MYHVDLDGDGNNESNLWVAECNTGLCVQVDSTVVATDHITLPANAIEVSKGSSNVIGRPIRVIGDHLGSPIHELAVLHQVSRGSHDSPALSVLDVDAGRVLATASALPELVRFEPYDLASFTDYPGDPDGQRYTGSGFRAMWNRVMRKYVAGGGEHFTYHDIRAKSGSDTDDDKLLGHQDPRTLHRVYKRKPTEVTPLSKPLRK